MSKASIPPPVPIGTVPAWLSRAESTGEVAVYRVRSSTLRAFLTTKSSKSVRSTFPTVGASSTVLYGPSASTLRSLEAAFSAASAECEGSEAARWFARSAVLAARLAVVAERGASTKSGAARRVTPSASTRTRRAARSASGGTPSGGTPSA